MPVKGRIVVDDVFCKGCELCASVCPQKVIQMAPDRITARLNELFATRKDLPFFAYNIRSIVHVETSCPSGTFLVANSRGVSAEEQKLRTKAAEDIYIALMNEGVLLLGDCKRMYACMQHDENALNKTLAAWEKVLAMIPVQG